MIEIIDQKYIKVTGGQSNWKYPKTILTTVDNVAYLEFDVTYDDHDEEAHGDFTWTEYYTYVLTCNVVFTNGTSIDTTIYRKKLAYKKRSKTNEQNPMSVRKTFDDMINQIQKEFIAAKTSFQTAIRNEAFELLMTNKLINQKTL